jgi:hypothetical protein
MRDAAVVAERRADRTSVEITNENSVAAAKADSRLAAARAGLHTRLIGSSYRVRQQRFRRGQSGVGDGRDPRLDRLRSVPIR